MIAIGHSCRRSLAPLGFGRLASYPLSRCRSTVPLLRVEGKRAVHWRANLDCAHHLIERGIRWPALKVCWVPVCLGRSPSTLSGMQQTRRPATPISLS
jgi:hypothetical protein